MGMHPLRSLSMCAAVAVALVCCAAAAMPDSGSSSASVGHQAWKFAYTSRLSQANITSVTAASPGDAWAVGTYLNSSQQTRPLVLHWNGQRWARFAVPGMPGSVTPTLVSATSPDNVWIFVRSNSDPSGQEFVWNGQSWSELPGPPASNGGAAGSAVVLSSGAAWEAGSNACPAPAPPACTSLWRWDGARWNLVQVPAFLDDLAGAGTRVWLVGQATSGTDAQPVIFRWNGTQWVKVLGAYNRVTLFPTIAPTSRGGLWLLSLAPNNRERTLLFHLRAGTWSSIAVPAAIQTSSSGMVADGFGGVWVASTAHWTGTRWIDTSQISPTPAGVWSLSAPVAVVPGSHSAWTAAVDCTSGCGTLRANRIAVNGPLP